MDIVPIFFCFNEKLLTPALVCISSLLENANQSTFYDIFIVHNPKYGLSDTKLKDIPKIYPNCRLTFRPVGLEFNGAYEVRGITIETYYRLLAPEIIPEYDKIIYSDVDVIFREDLFQYYQVELNDYYFAGVDNCSTLRPGVRQHLERIGLDWRRGYYYAGNIVMNLSLMREHRLQDIFQELAQKEFPQQDMDILNIACNGRIKPIGLSFCLTVQLYDLIINQYDKMASLYGADQISHALKKGIVHYNGQKPWTGICPNMDIWWDYYRRSLIYDERFNYTFWTYLRDQLTHLGLIKRMKLLLRYPIDRSKWK